jgi:exocyst complex component 8
MQSLRTRRPSQARPRGQKPGQGNRGPQAKDGIARKSTRVDDKIKKRMSMRYADISSPTGADIPAVPTIPLGLFPGGIKGQNISMPITEEPQEDPRAVELRLLDDEDFDPDACKLCCAYLRVVFVCDRMNNSFETEDGEFYGSRAALSPIISAVV